MRTHLVAAAAVLLTGCLPGQRSALREEPTWKPQSISRYAALQSSIDALFPDSLFPPSNAGISIVSMTDGKPLYQLNPDLLFTPASNQKLFTAAAALNALGEQYRFTTRISCDTSGVPTISIKGGGDPLLTTADIDSIASVVSTSVPPGRSWWLSGDISQFDDLPWGNGWIWDDEPDPTAMFISPLSLNSNCIRVVVEPAGSPHLPASVSTVPHTSYVTVESSCTTARDSVVKPLVVSRRWRERSNVITVEGEVSKEMGAVSRRVSVWQPEWYTMTVLKEALKRRGISTVGMVLDTVSQTSRTILSYTHDLDTVLTFMNKMSDNLSAENVLKTLGAEKLGRPGTAAGGISVIKSFLAATGIDTARIDIADGSGVSRYDLTTPATITSLLWTMFRQQSHFQSFYNSLPVAGEYGYLSARMKGTPAEHNVHAKTGTIQGVSSLSGYVRTADGELLAFSIIMENFPGKLQGYRDVQDHIVEYLSSLRRNDL